MNCKLGGELWGCNVPIAGLMVIGMDIYRDKVGGRSVAGIVTTLNGTFGKYWSQVRNGMLIGVNQVCTHSFSFSQKLKVVFENKDDRKSFMGEVCKAVRESVKRYAEANDGVLPEKIVIYRDGVNAGQYGIAKKEAVALTEAVEDVYTSPAGAAKPTPRPSIAVVIVQKKVYYVGNLIDKD